MGRIPDEQLTTLMWGFRVGTHLPGVCLYGGCCTVASLLNVTGTVFTRGEKRFCFFSMLRAAKQPVLRIQLKDEAYGALWVQLPPEEQGKSASEWIDSITAAINGRQ